MNVLKSYLRITIDTLHRNGTPHREIQRRTGVDRKTIRRYARQAEANSPRVATGFVEDDPQNPPPRPPAFADPAAALTSRTISACEPHRVWIEAQVALGRNAVSIYQDLVEGHGFPHRYNSVKRFVRTLKARAPERFDVLEFLMGEEAQVDYGLGAPTRTASGKYTRPALFVMTLKHSGKSFRKVVWKTNQTVWAQLHEEAFRSFGGCCQYVVLDNLKQGVLRPDWYEPALNPVYAALLAHYGVVADPCRVRDPNRKGTVESAIQHTQSTALKGRTFETLEAQNTWLAHWEEHWAATRIHGRKKRQVLELFREEQPHLRALPLDGFRYFTQGTRTVDDAGLVQVEGAYYAALPAPLHSTVMVRIYARGIEILDADHHVLRRHEKARRKGAFVMAESDRLFNPSRETARILARVAMIGPHTAALARELFSRLGRPGNRALYGLASLVRTYSRVDIEAVCERLLAAGCISYTAVKGALVRRAAATPVVVAPLTQTGPGIRAVTEYQDFWEQHGATDGTVAGVVR
ncbi:MAG: IS21 family transposase [Gemmatimonadaceae bacterium]